MNSQRWKIDDTTKPGHIFCEHTEDPRLIGELLSGDDVAEDDYPIAAPGGLWLANIRWLEDSHIYDEQDMYDSLEAALNAHQAAKRSVHVAK